MNKDTLLYALGGTITLSVVGIIVLLLMKFPEQRELINLSIGVLLTNFSMVVGFYFGSSQGSKDKNKTIKDV